jgi:hypothetical protein
MPSWTNTFTLPFSSILFDGLLFPPTTIIPYNGNRQQFFCRIKEPL